MDSTVGLAREIVRAVGIIPVEKGSLLLIGGDDVESFLSECEKRRALIVGIEGFELIGQQVTPNMEAIADFSGLSDSAQTVLESRRFIQAMNSSSLLFDFSIAETR